MPIKFDLEQLEILHQNNKLSAGAWSHENDPEVKCVLGATLGEDIKACMDAGLTDWTISLITGCFDMLHYSDLDKPTGTGYTSQISIYTVTHIKRLLKALQRALEAGATQHLIKGLTTVKVFIPAADTIVFKMAEVYPTPEPYAIDATAMLLRSCLECRGLQSPALETQAENTMRLLSTTRLAQDRYSDLATAVLTGNLHRYVFTRIGLFPGTVKLSEREARIWFLRIFEDLLAVIEEIADEKEKQTTDK